ncbi:MAG TPA: type II secretion system protein [Candidatus Paceibacterota bacterium]|nr:type II secretion system protein [Candidatus Paceibacterota bacterium]
MKRGFTLIELLVVIAIIGVLSSVVLASLNTARGKANDAKRLSDMHQVQTALELYNLKNNGYPFSNNSGCGGWESTGSDASNNNFVSALVADGDIPKGVKDPTAAWENSCGNYAYYLYPAGSYGCDASRGAYYVLGIRVTDGYGGNPYPSSPGWNCSGRNWQTEFSWVVGNYSQ